MYHTLIQYLSLIEELPNTIDIRVEEIIVPEVEAFIILFSLVPNQQHQVQAYQQGQWLESEINNFLKKIT